MVRRRYLVQAVQWPQWYPGPAYVRILTEPAGELHRESDFEFDTFGLHIDAKIGEFAPPARRGWFGGSTGLSAYRTWLLTDGGTRCHVVTEEAANGPGAIAIRHADPLATHNGHDLRLGSLKQLCETPPGLTYRNVRPSASGPAAGTSAESVRRSFRRAPGRTSCGPAEQPGRHTPVLYSSAA